MGIEQKVRWGGNQLCATMMVGLFLQVPKCNPTGGNQARVG